MTEEEFKKELERLGISVTDEKMHQLEQFYEILIKTNKQMNLTRIVEKEEVYLKHFYDSLTLVKAYSFEGDLSLCDVGSGAGFPGIVLKIFFPNLKVTLIDALQKRINYLNEVIEALGLVGIEAVHVRAEDLARQNRKFDIVTARAVAFLPKLLGWCMPLVQKNGVFLAMKGNVEEELDLSSDLLQKKHWTLEKKISFLLPKEESKRTILMIKKNEA